MKPDAFKRRYQGGRMAEVTWVACHSRTSVVPEQWATMRARVEHALSSLFEGKRRFSDVRSHIGLDIWVNEDDAPGQWRQFQRDDDGLAVNDGFPIGFDVLGVQQPDPGAIARSLRANPSRIEAMHPPYVNVSIDAAGLTIFVDALGFGKVYRAECQGRSVWSNSASLASLYAFGRVDPSVDGWVTNLSHSRFVADHTAVDGVWLERPRAVVTALDRRRGLTVDRPDYITPVMSGDPRDWDVADLVEESFTTFFDSLRRIRPPDIRVPLSGGRDSRVIAAMALRADLVDDFMTSIPPELDAEIAGRLIERLSTTRPWVRQSKSTSTRQAAERDMAAGVTVDDVWNRLIEIQTVFDGDGTVTPHSVPARPAPDRRVSLFGLGGTFGRAALYGEEHLADPEKRTSTFWRNLRGLGNLVEPGLKERVLGDAIGEMEASLRRRNVVGLKTLDYCYVFERARRVVNRVGNAARNIKPYYSVAYARAAMGRSPEYRVRGRWWRDVVNRNCPEWASVPYSHELKDANPVTSSASSHAEAFWQGPLIGPLGDDIIQRAHSQEVVLAAKVTRVVRPENTVGRPAVARMNSFNSLVNYFSYLAYTEEVNRRFTAWQGTVNSLVHL